MKLKCAAVFLPSLSSVAAARSPTNEVSLATLLRRRNRVSLVPHNAFSVLHSPLLIACPGHSQRHGILATISKAESLAVTPLLVLVQVSAALCKMCIPICRSSLRKHRLRDACVIGVQLIQFITQALVFQRVQPLLLGTGLVMSGVRKFITIISIATPLTELFRTLQWLRIRWMQRTTSYANASLAFAMRDLVTALVGYWYMGCMVIFVMFPCVVISIAATRAETKRFKHSELDQNSIGVLACGALCTFLTLAEIAEWTSPFGRKVLSKYSTVPKLLLVHGVLVVSLASSLVLCFQPWRTVLAGGLLAIAPQAFTLSLTSVLAQDLFPGEQNSRKTERKPSFTGVQNPCVRFALTLFSRFFSALFSL